MGDHLDVATQVGSGIVIAKPGAIYLPGVNQVSAAGGDRARVQVVSIVREHTAPNPLVARLRNGRDRRSGRSGFVETRLSVPTNFSAMRLPTKTR